MKNHTHRTSEHPTLSRTGLLVLCLMGLTLAASSEPSQQGTPSGDAIPALLSQTGLYSDIETQTIASDHLAYVPQYPLWSDGASKHRWIYLPEGTRIDATDADHWVFPVGTRLFKEFALGSRIETRLMQLGAHGWTYASYAWDEDGKEARLVPEKGLRTRHPLGPGLVWDIPGYHDCTACHWSVDEPVLGFNALQLSADRDPLAPHAEELHGMNLNEFVQAGLVQREEVENPEWRPRIDAASPDERALRGYLRTNCGVCHSAQSPLEDLGLFLDKPTIADLSNVEVLERMTTRDPSLQMPPLATRLVDEQAVALLKKWRATSAATSPSQ